MSMKNVRFILVDKKTNNDQQDNYKKYRNEQVSRKQLRESHDISLYLTPTLNLMDFTEFV